MPEASTPALETVRAEIRAAGPLTFARFMQIALYGEHGYYAVRPKPGVDYATSPQTHPAFGSLIAGYLYRAWIALDEPRRFDVVELGAGDGGLARDIVDAVAASSAKGSIARFRDAIDYHAFDLCPRGPAITIDELSDLTPIVGCVVSNELLDALPVHRFTTRDGELWELYVDIGEDDELTMIEGVVSTVDIANRLSDLVGTLPDGYRGEVNVGIHTWASRVSKTLRRGYVLTIDYGFERELLYHPGRSEGSLRCYRDHVLGQDPLRYVGEQDITAHVDFTSVQCALTHHGFRSASQPSTQRDFLFDLGYGEYNRQLREKSASEFDESKSRQLRSELKSLNALVDPRGLGGFTVAQHAIDAPPVDLSGLEATPVFALPTRQSHHLPYD